MSVGFFFKTQTGSDTSVGFSFKTQAGSDGDSSREEAAEERDKSVHADVSRLSRADWDWSSASWFSLTSNPMHLDGITSRSNSKWGA